MNQKQCAKWESIQSTGESTFIWKHGVLMWGLGAALLWAIIMELIQPSSNVIIRPLIALIVFPVGGYFLGKWVWTQT